MAAGLIRSDSPLFYCDIQSTYDTLMNTVEKNSTPKNNPVGRGVIGIIHQDNQYLMIQRAEGIKRGGYWCFPGGHVERDETSKMAILRELDEELGIRVYPVHRLGAVRILNPDYILSVWRVDHLWGDIKPAKNEIADIRWVRLQEIPTISPGLQSNQYVANLLKE